MVREIIFTLMALSHSASAVPAHLISPKEKDTHFQPECLQAVANCQRTALAVFMDCAASEPEMIKDGYTVPDTLCDSTMKRANADKDACQRIVQKMHTHLDSKNVSAATENIADYADDMEMELVAPLAFCQSAVAHVQKNSEDEQKWSHALCRRAMSGPLDCKHMPSAAPGAAEAYAAAKEVVSHADVMAFKLTASQQ